MKRIKVDIPAIKKYIRENGMTQVDVCRRIGRSSNFLCSCTGDMADYTYDLLIRELGAEMVHFRKRKSRRLKKSIGGVNCIRWGLMFPQKELFCTCIFRARKYVRRHLK